MTITSQIREKVRQHADFSCEYCGVKEQDSGDLLTIDHYHPTSKGGGDQLENLIYTCSRCNLYKHAYWPELANDLPLWNPRQEASSAHFLQLNDGVLVALTEVGEFTLK